MSTDTNNVPLLLSWNRLATRLLQPEESSETSSSTLSSAWIVLDSPLGAEDGWTPALLREELRDYYLAKDNPDSTPSLSLSSLSSKLQPARTAGDALTQDVLQILSKHWLGQGILQTSLPKDNEEDKNDDGDDEDDYHAAVAPAMPVPVQETASINITNHHTTRRSMPSTTTRGDRSVFLTPRLPTLPQVTRLVQAVHATVRHHLTDLVFDFTRTSVQLAEYPGNGTACYPRHCDRQGACRGADEAHTIGNNNNNNNNNNMHTDRLLTVLYYLTPDDWHAVNDHGALRIYHDNDNIHQHGTNNNNNNFYTDVIPYADRMVIFRSDCVEHAVLPSLRRPRQALTIWLYGRVQQEQVVAAGNDRKEDCATDATTNSPSAVHQNQPTVAPNTPLPLPISNSIDEHCQTATIFVSMASFRDSETAPTLRNLHQTARFPNRIFVGLVLQVNTNDDYKKDDTQDDQVAVLNALPTHLPWYHSNVRVLQMSAHHATGPCPARALAQCLHRGEAYVLQIDAHMRFRPHWDVYLLQQWQACPNAERQRNLLSTYPAAYQRPNVIPQPNMTRGTLLYPWKFDDDGMLRQKARYLTDAEVARHNHQPVWTGLFAAGFCFGPSAWLVQDCPYDHRLHHLFFGEELSMTLRLYTNGYDVYAPCETVCYHLWSRSHRPLGNPIDPVLRCASQAIVKEQLCNGKGLGLSRTVAEWEARVGVDLRQQKVFVPPVSSSNDNDNIEGDRAGDVTVGTLDE